MTGRNFDLFFDPGGRPLPRLISATGGDLHNASITNRGMYQTRFPRRTDGIAPDFACCLTHFEHGRASGLHKSSINRLTSTNWSRGSKGVCGVETATLDPLPEDCGACAIFSRPRAVLLSISSTSGTEIPDVNSIRRYPLSDQLRTALPS